MWYVGLLSPEFFSADYEYIKYAYRVYKNSSFSCFFEPKILIKINISQGRIKQIIQRIFSNSPLNINYQIAYIEEEAEEDCVDGHGEDGEEAAGDDVGTQRERFGGF